MSAEPGMARRYAPPPLQGLAHPPRGLMGAPRYKALASPLRPFLFSCWPNADMLAGAHGATVLAQKTHAVDVRAVRGRELWPVMGQRGRGSPVLLTSKPRNVRKTISLSIHSLGFSATLCYLRHCTSYRISPPSAVRRSRTTRPAPVWAPGCAPRPPLCGHDDLTRTWVRQVIPTQNAPPSGRHLGLWWHQTPGVLSPACCSGLKTQARPAILDKDSPHTQAFDRLSSASDTLPLGHLLQATSWSKAGLDISLGWPILSHPSSAAG